MKKIKRTIAAMTAGLLCLAGTPTLPAEIQRTILLNANAADDVAADENAWYLRNGLNVSVALAPGEQKQLTFKCRKLNENNYYSYSELGYNEISQYVQISSDYDESLIQVDEETGYITAVEGTDGGTTQFTMEDAQGNVQEVNVRVVGRDLEIVGMHVQSDNSYYFLDGSDTQDIDVYLGWNYGELRISYDYYTGYPDYEFIKDTYSPDLCEEVTYDDYYISFDKETGVFRVYGGQSEIVITGSNGFEQKLNVWGYVDATTTRASTTTSTTTSMTTTAAYIPETVTTEEESETTTQALRTETYAAETTTYNEPEPMATTSYYVPETVTTETIRTETYPVETTSYYVYVPETYVTTTAMTYDIAETTRMTTTSYYVPETYETTTSSTTTSSTMTSSTTTSSTMTSSTMTSSTTTSSTTTSSTTTSSTTTSSTTTSSTTTSSTTTSSTTTSYTTTSSTTTTTSMVVTTETTSLATTTENTTEIPIDTTTQATTEVPIETTTTEAMEEPTTDDPNNGEDLPETGTTGMPLERVAEYSALALIIGGAVMILKSRKKED